MTRKETKELLLSQNLDNTGWEKKEYFSYVKQYLNNTKTYLEYDNEQAILINFKNYFRNYPLKIK